MTDSVRYWAIVPAAGIGVRAGSQQPKQYLSLLNKTVIEHTLEQLLSFECIEKIYVPLNEKDQYWQSLSVSNNPRIVSVEGGDDRYLSVFNALKIIKENANSNDWVLVHDAARPCVTQKDIQKLISATVTHPVGGILGVPVNDTLKRVSTLAENNKKNNVGEEISGSSREIIETVDRSSLWAAYTPQIFRFNLLYEALRTLIKAGTVVTDESMAIEYSGYQPLMVEGQRDNIKITLPGDLEMAEKIIKKNNNI